MIGKYDYPIFKIFKKPYFFELAGTPAGHSKPWPCLQLTFSEQPSDRGSPYSEFLSTMSPPQVKQWEMGRSRTQDILAPYRTLPVTDWDVMNSVHMNGLYPILVLYLVRLGGKK